MSTWGYEPLENDVAEEFLTEWAERFDYECVEELLDEIESIGEDYIELELAQSIIAAAYVACAIEDSETEDLFEDQEELQIWANKMPAPRAGFMNQLSKALKRLMQGESEVRELWEESQDYAAWRATLEEMIHRS